jgi:hypothetical protein
MLSHAVRRSLVGDMRSVCGEAMSGWGWWQVNGGNDGWGGNGPLSGARVGDRFALALISLALDEVDATELLGGRR